MSNDLNKLVELSAFYRLTATDDYLTWLRAELQRYQTQASRDVHRNNMFPIDTFKNFRAFLKEQGQDTMARDMDDLIKKHS